MTATGLNPRQEEFCRLFVQGLPAYRAYMGAGYTARGDAARTNATRLLTNAHVRERVEELRREADEAALLSIREKRDFLARVIRTPVCAVDENSPLAQSCKRSGGAGGQVLEVRMVDKLKAIELDNKLAGHCAEAAPQREVNILFDIDKIPPSDWTKLRKDAIEPDA